MKRLRTHMLPMACVALIGIVGLLIGGCDGGGGAAPLPAARQDIGAAQLQAMMNDGGPLLIADVRTDAEFAVGHIPGSESLPLADIDTWAANYDLGLRICCVSAAGVQSFEAANTLVAQGFRYVYNLLGGIDGWPGPLDPPPARHDITAAELLAMMADGDPLIIIDVRTASEYAGGHIPGSVNLPIADIETWSATLDPELRICCVCWSGARSASAADTLVAKGFRRMHNLLGGMSGWPGPVE